MPTYDYKCGACGHLFEHFQSISDARLKKCPKCGKPKLERLIGAGGGLLFKGSGFYITDYRNSSYHEAAKKDAAPAGDAKPAADGTAGAKSPASPPSETKAPAAKEGGAKSPPPAAPAPAAQKPASSGGSKRKGR